MMKKQKKSNLGDIEKQIKDEAKIRLNRCIPIAIELITLLSEHPIVLGEAENVKSANVYDDVAKALLQTMLEAKINYSDRQFVFQLAMQAIEMTQEKVISSLEKSYEIVREKMWGKNYFDITLEDIDKKLKS